MPISSSTTCGRNACAEAIAECPSKVARTSWPSNCNNSAKLSVVSALSSTTRIRRGAIVIGGAAVATLARLSTWVSSGRRSVNVLPCDRPLLAAEMAPPCICASRRAIDSPMPRPPSVRSSERSACVNSSKMTGNSAGAMPMPLSTIVSSASVSWRSSVNDMRPRRVVYFAALVNRLATICTKRLTSPSTMSASSGRSTVN